jgi:glycosyltransferase involved in cell wall biosynthesis
VHHHGTEYRNQRAPVDAACRRVGAVQVASTLDLVGPALWLPSVVDVERLAAFRGPVEVMVAHSPSLRRLKQTDAVIAATGKLGVGLDLIERVSWDDCLARKGRAAIVVDQLVLGYGLSAIEAWCMGIPVVAGTTDPETRRRMVETFGELPFVEATPETLADRLAELVASPDLRREWGERGRAHVERFHSEPAVVERLEAIYRRAA